MMRRVVTSQQGDVIYVSGHDRVRSVTNEDQTTRIPRASTPNRSQPVIKGWPRRDLLAIAAVGALALIADGATLLLIARMTG